MQKISEILGVDLGGKRTGLARISMQAKIAEPLMAVPTELFKFELQKAIIENKSEAVVFGLPTGRNGDDSEQTKWVKDFVMSLKRDIDLPIYFQDETLSTVEATERYDTSKHDIDSLAACVILEDFIALPEDEWQEIK